MKKLLFLIYYLIITLVSAPALGGYYGYQGYNSQCLPPGLVAWYHYAPNGHNGDTGTWEDLTPAGNDTDLTGVSAPAIGADGSRTFDGANDYFVQKTYDTQQGALTFVADAGSAEFRDAGQDFSAWETTSGNAAYMIVVTSDNGVSWGYMGASNNSGADIDIYSDIALTTRAWKGRTTPNGSGDTPASYVVRKTDFQITSSMSILMWVKPDDGQPDGGAQSPLAKYSGNTASTASFVLQLDTAGKILFYTTDGTDALDYEKTDDAVFSNGAQSAFTHIAAVYTYGVGASVVLYKNGSAVASSTTGTIQISLLDSYLPICVGTLPAVLTQKFKGQIASVMIFNTALSETEIERVYNMHRARF